jgi:hypothetical protein
MHPFTNASLKRALLAPLVGATLAGAATAQEPDLPPTPFERIAESIERSGSALTEPRLLGFIGVFFGDGPAPAAERPGPLSFLDGLSRRLDGPTSLGGGRPPDDPWASDRVRLEGPSRSVQTKADLDVAALTSKVKFSDPDPTPLDPATRRSWETDESLKVPLTGPLFAFGDLGASSPSVQNQEFKWLTKTGLGCKLNPWLVPEVQVRGGPAMRYDNTQKLDRGQSPEHSELFLEVVTKLPPLPVLGALNVEYSGVAVPALTPAERDKMNQDLKVALPFGGGSGQFHIGAKLKRDDSTTTATPWVDRMELYMGLKLQR